MKLTTFFLCIALCFTTIRFMSDLNSRKPQICASCILSFIIVLLSCSSQAQTYYGKKMFGRIQTINDSTSTVTFISWGTNGYIDTCYVRKHGDTVFLSTKARWKYKVNVFEERQISANPSHPIIVKIYEYSFPDKKYNFIDDDIGIYDSVTKSIVLEDVRFYQGLYIIVCKPYSYYRVKCYFERMDPSYITIERNQNFYFSGVVFDEFPLLIKGNRLIPIDKEKQMQCWLDNGFLFPRMKMNKKQKEYHIIGSYYIGLRNLSEEIENLKPLPRRYMKYLEN